MAGDRIAWMGGLAALAATLALAISARAPAAVPVLESATSSEFDATCGAALQGGAESIACGPDTAPRP